MSDNSPQFNSKGEFLEWARKNWKANSQFCANHWAPFALRESEGGILFSLIYITDLVFMDAELAERGGGNPETAMQLASPFCCHYGEETYEKVMAEVNAPDEWLMECLMVPRPGSPERKCKGVLHDPCREAREANG